MTRQARAVPLFQKAILPDYQNFPPVAYTVYGCSFRNGEKDLLLSVAWPKGHRRRFYEEPDCMMWVQLSPCSRCCVLG